MPEPPVPAATLAGLDSAGLADAMRPLWEDAGPLVEALLGVAVQTWEEHIGAAEATIAGMDEPTRVRLLAAHPRLGEEPARLAARSATSWREQGGDSGDAAVLAELSRLNDLYESRFGFPFVEWVAGRSRAEMATALAGRLAASREAELAAGCAALVAIARDRLAPGRAAPGPRPEALRSQPCR